MKDLDLFQMALGLGDKWIVTKSEFTREEKRLDIYIDFIAGTLFPCSECGTESKVHDTFEKVWRHLNFFQFAAYIHARIPRVNCQQHGVKLIEVPWARKQSGFTLYFEALIMALAKEMPVKAIADIVGEVDKRLWRIIEHYVNQDLERQDLSEVKAIGVDETSTKKGHNYVSLFVDMDKSKVVHVTEGKDSSTLQAFKKHLTEHGGDPEKISEFSCDLSPAFISGVQEHFPKANITFDRFHVMKLLNKAVDEVRRDEQITEAVLKKSRYVWLKNPQNLSEKQQKKLESLSTMKLKIARAYRMKLVFQDIFANADEDAIDSLKKWYAWAVRSRLEPVKAFAKTLKKHWIGIIHWFQSKLTNGILEGLNSLVQAAKARARGYRSVHTLKIMIYLIAGKMGLLSI
jgi:transposase